MNCANARSTSSRETRGHLITTPWTRSCTVLVCGSVRSTVRIEMRADSGVVRRGLLPSKDKCHERWNKVGGAWTPVAGYFSACTVGASTPSFW